MSELLERGIYVIINKKLKTVYVGQTRRSFLLRWAEHLVRVEKYADDLHRLQLYLDEHTKFIAVKKIDSKDVLPFYQLEHEAMDFYEERGWLVVSERTPRTIGMEFSKSEVKESHRALLKHMITFLGVVDVKEKYVGRLYNQIYKKINKEFSTDVTKRAAGKSVIDVLEITEMESVLLDLYPRYKAKRLAYLRKKFGY